ncbi:hypothetical protein OSB04_008807 [Centaurea solstitialis]|uniref:Uncharacterized protein n=1 Tax=Centaurea solstitialis TaxID=347529 RepID=A0AA38WJW3_9ASTR|nr:hypothetical protein OSB04_008807 [Centaurea solstitialis]
MGEPLKGTVTPLSSVFAPEEAQKASIRVQETISERRKEVDQLQGFLNDNNSLINLVKKLPNQLHHDIMASLLHPHLLVISLIEKLNFDFFFPNAYFSSLVPFGKAAFFPGRLIHTNEFLVLLGEGYYADRTSKQTVEILKRRGKNLESQIETLNAIIKDLKFEASFFDETAIEASEGIVEIREDYVDEASNEDEPTKGAGEDDFARMLSRIDELEKEELEAEIAEEHEEEEEEEEEDKADLSHLMSRTSLEPEDRSSEEQMKNDHSISKRSSQNYPPKDVSKPLKFRFIFTCKSTHIKWIEASSEYCRAYKLKESLSHTPVSMNEVSTPASNSSNHSGRASVVAPVSKEVSNSDSNVGSDRSKAFTGSIVERTHNIENNQKGQTQTPASKPMASPQPYINRANIEAIAMAFSTALNTARANLANQTDTLEPRRRDMQPEEKIDVVLQQLLSSKEESRQYNPWL